MAPTHPHAPTAAPHLQVHVILKAFNPATGKATEHHLAQPPAPPNDKLPHVYTLVLSAADDRWGPAAFRSRQRPLLGLFAHVN
jgi:hypothetical protein